MPDVVTLQEAVHLTKTLGRPFSYMQLYNRLVNGKITGHRIGNTWVTPRKEIEALTH